MQRATAFADARPVRTTDRLGSQSAFCAPEKCTDVIVHGQPCQGDREVALGSLQFLLA